jgi:hypothetical protein
MVSDLIKRVRKCSDEEREELVAQMVRNGDNDAIKELIRMVESWFRDWFLMYNYKDQLLGIKYLGETRNPEALEFLKKLMVCEYAEKRINHTEYDGQEWVEMTTRAGYPNAVGRLRAVLAWENGDRRTRSQETRDAHLLIQSSINKLKADLELEATVT